MIILFILGLLLGAVSVVFSLQNITLTTVTFFNWQLQSSLAVILLLAITSGILICLLILLPGSINTSLKFRALKKENKKIEEELRKQRELTTFARNDSPTRHNIEAIEDGAISPSH